MGPVSRRLRCTGRALSIAHLPRHRVGAFPDNSRDEVRVINPKIFDRCEVATRPAQEANQRLTGRTVAPGGRRRTLTKTGTRCELLPPAADQRRPPSVR
jgi:hypothetical protein